MVDAVADRITGSRTTVARYTPKLVRLGLLIHDRNEDGTCKTHSYKTALARGRTFTTPKLSPLSRPEIAAGFEMSRQAISQKRQAAGRKGGRPKLQMELFDESNLLQTSQSNLLQTGQTNLQQTKERFLELLHEIGWGQLQGGLGMNYELRGDNNVWLTCGAKLIASITPEQWVAPSVETATVSPGARAAAKRITTIEDLRHSVTDPAASSRQTITPKAQPLLPRQGSNRSIAVSFPPLSRNLSILGGERKSESPPEA